MLDSWQPLTHSKLLFCYYSDYLFLHNALNYRSSRKMPGRIIGVSIDSRGKPALRMAMQTREQHIRRDKATSNICTAQALLANMAAFYAVYHGPDGLRNIARRIHGMARVTAAALKGAGSALSQEPFFDCFTVDVSSKNMTASQVQEGCVRAGVNVRVIDEKTVGISFGESITRADVEALVSAFGIAPSNLIPTSTSLPGHIERTTEFLTHPVFNTYRSETQMLRYMKNLESRDLSLNFSMISLGSCTMKLNATSEMIPVTWPEVSRMHPFAPLDQSVGYQEMIASLNLDLALITGFAAVSTQPNSGAQVIRICFI
jgi:glycine dehydrogenase